MSEMTNERLQEIIEWAEVFGRHPRLHECAEMARRLFAAEAQLAELRGQAPVAFQARRYGEADWHYLFSPDHADDLKARKRTGHTWEFNPLYANPVPPAANPVDFKENDDADKCRKLAWAHVKEQVTPDGWTVGDNITYFGFFCWGWDMRRQYNEQRPAPPAASQPNERVKRCDNGECTFPEGHRGACSQYQGEPASQPYTVPDECSFDGLDKDSKDYEVARIVGQVEGWNSYRAAMLQSGNSPVIGWLRADYNSDDRRDPNPPLFMLGSNDPSETWGVTYIPPGSNSLVVADGSTCRYCGGTGYFRWQQSENMCPCPCVGCDFPVAQHKGE